MKITLESRYIDGVYCTYRGTQHPTLIVVSRLPRDCLYPMLMY
jgi:hypothetical protein